MISDCPSGFYGINCLNQCGAGCPDGDCDKVTGQCNRDCTEWWAGDKCDVNIGMLYN